MTDRRILYFVPEPDIRVEMAVMDRLTGRGKSTIVTNIARKIKNKNFCCHHVGSSAASSTRWSTTLLRRHTYAGGWGNRPPRESHSPSVEESARVCYVSVLFDFCCVYYYYFFFGGGGRAVSRDATTLPPRLPSAYIKRSGGLVRHVNRRQTCRHRTRISTSGSYNRTTYSVRTANGQFYALRAHTYTHADQWIATG